jgi:Fic family protein
MFREIKQKQIILENRKPYSPQACEYMTELNMSDWICSSLRLDGGVLTKSQIQKILKGELLIDVALSLHALVENHCNVYNAACDMLEMSHSLNTKGLISFARKLTGDKNLGYRKTNPVLVALDYNPPHPAEIEEQMELLMVWFHSDDLDFNPLKKAAILHHRIIEIYPFESVSEAVARAAMYYFLMENGYHPFEITLSEREYNLAITQYLKKENVEPFYNAIAQNIFHKMEVLIQLTAKN